MSRDLRSAHALAAPWRAFLLRGTRARKRSRPWSALGVDRHQRAEARITNIVTESTLAAPGQLPIRHRQSPQVDISADRWRPARIMTCEGGSSHDQSSQLRSKGATQARINLETGHPRMHIADAPAGAGLRATRLAVARLPSLGKRLRNWWALAEAPKQSNGPRIRPVRLLVRRCHRLFPPPSSGVPFARQKRHHIVGVHCGIVEYTLTSSQELF